MKLKLDASVKKSDVVDFDVFPQKFRVTVAEPSTDFYALTQHADERLLSKTTVNLFGSH